MLYAPGDTFNWHFHGSLLFVVTNVRYLCLIYLYSELGAIRELRGGLGALS